MSDLMIQQHFPTETHDGYTREGCSKITEVTGMSPLSITKQRDRRFPSYKKTQNARRNLMILWRSMQTRTRSSVHADLTELFTNVSALHTLAASFL